MSTLNPLESWRTSNGLSVVDAAKAIGVRRQHWYRLAASEALPRPTTASRIEQITGVSRAALAAAMSQAASN